ncbi:peptidase M61 [Wolbachia endosymbiont of Anopheles demeilloni]|uniref:M61 family metallopeptidase n=1 Tax=Wolbachia endosymbiont of Anopheles demeilloni TaxID=2748871 RepID=UPI001F371149|nr:peptidase M61 [Wolbachia endosymbiont of Anopheles demeilloni]UIP92457.1 peptidase M61 [Wolbachia endosymbiont of Anopheles demeilloni]
MREAKKNIKDYTRVISHELIHRYIGHIIEQDNDKKNEIKYKWFFEGFTEFYGLKTLLDTKLIDKDEYLKIINITLKEYFNSLIPNIDFEKINQKHLLDQNISMLSYNRGFILAMIIDEKLNEVSNGRYNLLTIVNSIISEITSKQVNFNVDLFANHLKYYLPESFIKDIIASIRDSSILLSLLPSRLLNKNLTFQDTDKYSDICFNLTKSLELQKIRGVKLGSDCHNMGLKNGQELKCYSIDFNSGNIKLKVLENKIPKVIYLKANKITSSTPIYK